MERLRKINRLKKQKKGNLDIKSYYYNYYFNNIINFDDIDKNDVSDYPISNNNNHNTTFLDSEKEDIILIKNVGLNAVQL